MVHLPKAALQNNIGALMLLKNCPSEAKERFYASIATIRPHANETISELIPEFICPNIDVEPAGLVWFDNRLLKEVARINPPRNDQLEIRVPLGLEYFQHPIRVRTLADARIAAGVNLALILFREAKPVEQVISVLKWALSLDGGNTSQSQEADPLLIALAHTNMGVLRFIQHNNRAAMHNFIKANSILSQSRSLDGEEATNGHHHLHLHPQPWAGNNVPMDYLTLTIMLNHTHTAIITNRENSKDFCDALFSAASSITCYKSFYRIKRLVITSMNYIPGLLQQEEEYYDGALASFNTMLSKTRKEWGHDHVHVAAILEKKGAVQFEQKKYQNAMLSFLASWKIYQHFKGYELEESRLLYAIGRTLHDREEFSDALKMYQKAFALREEIEHTSKRMTIDSIQILCNICRIHHMMGDLQLALEANEKIVGMASEMVGGGETASSHAFVRNRLIVLGNVYVEMGRLREAMECFTTVARTSPDGDGTISTFARPEMEDVDTNAIAVRAAERLGNLSVKLKFHAPAA